MQHIIAEQQPPRGKAGHPARILRWLTMLGMGVALGMLALGGALLLDARKDAWRQAEQASNNLALALERDIARNIAVHDLSLQGAIAALQQPGLDQTSPAIRQMAVFDRAASAEYLGSILVLDSDGNILADSTSPVPHRLNFADRDYFRIHREQPETGLYISRPYRSRLRGGDPSIAISRRLPGPDGSFAGVAMGALRIAYFRELFGRLDLGARGAVTLFRADGRVIARHPFREADVDRDLSGADNFRRFIAARSGHFVATAAIDGVRRLYTFRHIGDLPLVLSVAVSVDEVYAAWWRKAVAIGSILVVLCGGMVALCLLFRREMLRRIAAEAALTEAAGRLAVMASTDGLTGLTNRRQFDESLDREWRRAARNEMPLSLLLLDADHFKAYNDRYGHQAGDKVLQGIAACIRETVHRPADAGARYGGEEFAVLLPETDAPGALTIAERLHGAVASLGVPHAGSPIGQVSVSVGLVTLWPHAGMPPERLVKEADEALYEAKRTGRNRIGIAGHADAPGPAWAPVRAKDAQGAG